jgi:imidazolonepropionase-like amidohydrolase
MFSLFLVKIHQKRIRGITKRILHFDYFHDAQLHTIMRILFLFIIIWSFHLTAQWTPQNGVEDSKAQRYVLKNARIIVSPEKTIEKGTLIIEGDRIVDVGALIFSTGDAVEIDCDGLTIVPAFVELWTSIGLPKPVSGEYSSFRPQLNSSKKGAYYWNESIHPEVNAAGSYSPDAKAITDLHKMGVGFALTHIPDGIAQGTGTFVSLSPVKVHQHLLRDKAAQFFSFENGISRQTYPSSQMGSIALLKQAFHDLEWYTNAKPAERNFSLDELNNVRQLPAFMHTDDKWEILRAQKIADEFKLNMHYIGSGNEYAAVEALKKIKQTIVLPIHFPEAFDVKDPYIARQIPVSDLKHWELAPANPSILQSNGIKIALSSYGQKSPDAFWKNLRKAISHGLTESEALASLTLEPARLLGMETEIGSLEKGKLASFAVYSANPFETEAKVFSVWTLGEENVLDVPQTTDISGKYNLFIDDRKFPIEITGKPMGWSGTLYQARVQKDPKNGEVTDTVKVNLSVEMRGSDVVIQFNLSDERWKGSLNLHAKHSSKFGVFEGDALLPDGRLVPWSAIRNNVIQLPERKDKKSPEKTVNKDVWQPNMAYGYSNQALPKVETVVFDNVTVWTNENEGVIRDATVITSNGKITYVGKGNYSILPQAKVVNGKGKHLTSGIIDEHSHIALYRGVNEGGQSISAEVNIGDVIYPEDINVYRQLAGGVTAAQLLHGSANPIGGQSGLIKLKWGHEPDEFLIKDAPKFIKCALGENVKQSNWGDFNTVRFPQTRMGVEQVYYNGFNRARQYMKEWENYRNGTGGSIAPRKDLELEVLAEILRSERFITCHSYIQSEINMLMHVADSVGIKINTFTHILEGYKVADKMRRHGAGGSTFSDWWAYKFEVNDAIPYNAKLMADQGIVVAINSDDAEMGRRLNQEAAKAVKYGGMSEEEAWKMVTLNPAKLLHLDDRMGSVKVGKDADLVLWSDNPLSINAIAEMTLVDGEVLYDQSKSEELARRNQEERARIISLMLASNEKGEESKPFVKRKSRRYHCDTLGEEGTTEENTH